MGSESSEQRQLAAIMFTDMVGYSALAQRDEPLAVELLQEHRRLLRPLFPSFNGREVETAGDAFLVEFASALDATRCAVEIQRLLAERNQAESAARRIQLRVGIHIGDIIHKDGKIMGDAVNIAARIEPLAPAGGICVSNAVFEQVRNKLMQGFASLGPAELKNIQMPVAVHRVVMPWEKENAPLASAPRRRRKASPWKWPAAVGAVALVALALLWHPWTHPRHARGLSKETAASAAADKPAGDTVPPAVDEASVAVLAFTNLSEDKGNEYFSEGISEELLNVLAKIPGLKVSARTSAFHFKGSDIPVPEIARQLGVAYVVEGSVRKSGDRVRITAQLIKAATGFHVWSDTFTRELKDIFAVQDEIAGLIAKNLSLKMGLASSGGASVNPEVLKLYLQGRQLWSLRSDAALAQMEAVLTRALQLDPSFAPAEAGLAQVWVTRVFVLVGAAHFLEQELASGEAHARRAIELDPTSAEAFEALGTAALVRGRFAESETALQKAIALNPNYAPGWNKYGWLLLRRGRFDEALEKFNKARELDPFVWSIVDGAARGLMQNGRFVEAADLFAQSRALPVSAPVSWANGAVALLLAGRTNEALPLARVVIQDGVKGDWNRGLRDWSQGIAAWVLADAGARDEAKAMVDRLLAEPPPRRCTAGLALLALDRADEGCAVLADLPQQIVSYLWMFAQRHPAVASDPRFQHLLEQLNAVDDFRVARDSLARIMSARAAHK